MPRSNFFVAATPDIPPAILGQPICLIPQITLGRFKKISSKKTLNFYIKGNPLKLYSTAKENLEILY